MALDNPITRGAAEAFWGADDEYHCWHMLGEKISEQEDTTVEDQIIDTIECTDDLEDLKELLLNVFETSDTNQEFFNRLKIKMERD